MIELCIKTFLHRRVVPRFHVTDNRSKVFTKTYHVDNFLSFLSCRFYNMQFKTSLRK